VPLDAELTGTLRSLDPRELRRVLIFVRGLLLAHGETPPPEEIDLGNVTYRLEGVRCGKPDCRSCPHGPYWYAYYREGDRLRSHYIGRHLPSEAGEIGNSAH
jgi:hypothetical protein